MIFSQTGPPVFPAADFRQAEPSSTCTDYSTVSLDSAWLKSPWDTTGETARPVFDAFCSGQCSHLHLIEKNANRIHVPRHVCSGEGKLSLKNTEMLQIFFAICFTAEQTQISGLPVGINRFRKKIIVWAQLEKPANCVKPTSIHSLIIIAQIKIFCNLFAYLNIIHDVATKMAIVCFVVVLAFLVNGSTASTKYTDKKKVCCFWQYRLWI